MEMVAFAKLASDHIKGFLGCLLHSLWLFL